MRRLGRWVAVPLAAAALGLLAFRVPLPAYTQEPGSLVGLAERVEVEGHPGRLHGDVRFGTVLVRTATVAGVLRAGLDERVQLVRRERLIPQGTTPTAFFAQQRAEFDLAVDVAAAVALRAAGLAVDPDALRGEGALITRVVDGGPAAGVLEPGDVIVRAGGEDVDTAEAFTRVAAAHGRDPVGLRVRRGRRAAEVTLEPGTTRSGEPSLGLVVTTYRPRVDLPVDVRVDEDRVGGPSAGLATALAVYDVVAPEDLLAGRRVVATGSVDSGGRVGEVGGVELKAIAAALAEADLLLVPADQEARARAAAPGVAVTGVARFADALEALRTGG